MSEPSGPAGKKPRFPSIPPDRMTEAQKAVAAQFLQAATRADGPGGRHMASTGQLPGPYNFLLRSPELAVRWRGLGDYIRFESSVPQRLNELAILIQARLWTAQFEWWAHYPLALRAGLPEAVANDIREAKRPSSMQPDEAAVYDFCVELTQDRKVSDRTFERLRALFTEQQIVDLVAVSGFYGTVSMVLNTAEAEIPGGGEPPLRPLQGRLT